MPIIFVFQKMKSREHQCGRGTFWHSIITYKSLTGDYSLSLSGFSFALIITYKSLTGEYSYIHNVPLTLNIITHNSLVEMNIKDTPSYLENLIRFVVRLSIW